LNNLNSSKSSLNGWEVETHISNTSVYSSPRGVVLMDVNNSHCLARLTLREENVIIEFNTVKINIPANQKVIQFL